MRLAFLWTLSALGFLTLGMLISAVLADAGVLFLLGERFDASDMASGAVILILLLAVAASSTSARVRVRF